MRRSAGLLLVASGLVLLAWLVLTPVLSTHQTARAQQRLAAEVPAALPGGGHGGHGGTGPDVLVMAGVPAGHALAHLRIPRFGEDWSWTVVEGTTDGDLVLGPGHYPGTPLPGARGNSAIAAHRAGHGDPFLDFDTLRAGDEVVLDQGGVTWTYRIHAAPEIVPVDAVDVLGPTTGRQLTLTTCWPRYGSSKRMWVRGGLVSVDRDRQDSFPAEVALATGRDDARDTPR